MCVFFACFLFFVCVFILVQNKICPFLRQGICIYVGISFLNKHNWTNSVNLYFSVESGIVV